MRASRPRLSIGMAMIAVALIAVMLSTLKLRARQVRYREMAAGCLARERHSLAVIAGDRSALDFEEWAGNPDRHWHARLAEHFHRMRLRFSDAASRPWIDARHDEPPK